MPAAALRARWCCWSLLRSRFCVESASRSSCQSIGYSCFAARADSSDKLQEDKKALRKSVKKVGSVKKESTAGASKLAKELARGHWLTSLTSPLTNNNGNLQSSEDEKSSNEDNMDAEIMAIGGAYASEEILVAHDSQCVIGIDPDFHGAIAVLRMDNHELLAEVFDVPTVKVAIAKGLRSRPDARSIVKLLHDLNVPQGTIAYVEHSSPFPKDGKQGWWSAGFGYGLWIGSLMASGISVVPVTARLWKAAMGLPGDRAYKDESRKRASMMFPSVAPQLQRKKDHGRAEALLIAAFGKGLVGTQTGSTRDSSAVEKERKKETCFNVHSGQTWPPDSVTNLSYPG